MRAAAVQLNSTEDRPANLTKAAELTRAAAADGSELVVLPEHFDLRGSDEAYARGAEALDGPTVTWARELARDLRIDLVAGSFMERRDGHEKPANTSLHVGRDGELRGVYRKVHLFDVSVGGVDYGESANAEPGDELVVTEVAGTPVGLTVCYDLRFPELYRILALRGALIATVPANFTQVTGEAHWEVLLRARAIENQLFVVAAAQVGASPPEQGDAYGNSLIADPWGTVLARASGDEETFIAADLDFARLADVREKLPSLANRVPAAYRWPAEVHA
ncbi:MAG: deaminated glutathione amidase [Thermoleophilaceae bacterium]|jgi:predicted amidohydrolase|nr:deaminated glutathione amidase [Thermoleophilaceae bacterium]